MKKRTLKKMRGYSEFVGKRTNKQRIQLTIQQRKMTKHMKRYFDNTLGRNSDKFRKRMYMRMLAFGELDMKAYYIGIKGSSTWDLAWAKGLSKAEVAKKVFEGWHTNKIKFADVECKRVPEIDNMEDEPMDLTFKTLVEKCDWFINEDHLNLPSDTF